MTDCPTHNELLGGYLLGALDSEEMDDMRRHLAGCPVCSREIARLGDIPALLDTIVPADIPPPVPPAELEEALLDRVAREGRERPSGRTRRRRRVFGGLAAAAGAAAVALVLVLSLGGGDDAAYATASLHGVPGAEASVDVRAVDAGTRVWLKASGLESDGGYQLWCIDTEGRWVSGGSFRARDGMADVVLTAAVEPGQYHRLVVTPAGSREPAVLRGQLEY